MESIIDLIDQKLTVSGIYKIICCNNKFYIGSSINIDKRLNDHVGLLKRNKHKNKYLQNAWNKYGDKNFRFEIIETINDTSLLPIKEKEWIDNTNCCNKSIGFNISSNPHAPYTGRFIDITGQKFGKLTVDKYIGKTKIGGISEWLCSCDCGREIVVRSSNLKNEHTRSCGCAHVKHGHSKKGKLSKAYRTWYHMIQRCTSDINKSKGITVCCRWSNKNPVVLRIFTKMWAIPQRENLSIVLITIMDIFQIIGDGQHKKNKQEILTEIA